jgi:hypothetical protein
LFSIRLPLFRPLPASTLLCASWDNVSTIEAKRRPFSFFQGGMPILQRLVAHDNLTIPETSEI